MDEDRISGGDDDGRGGGDLEPGASGAVSVAEGGGPRDPSEIRDPLPQPLLSWRRLAMVALLALAVGCIVVAARSGGSSDDIGISTDEAIVSYLPTPGGRVQRQSAVGVELEPGYDGRLTINEVEIPEEQMVGAIVPGSAAADAQTDEERQLGPRPNNKQLVMFQPGEGKAITEYDTGSVEISVELWKESDGRQTARTVTYAVNVF